MASEKPERTPPRDDFVREMLGDRDYGEGDVVAIAGLVGDSPRVDFVRLYTNPDLSECLDIPEDAIRRHQPLDKSRSPLGGSTLWVDSNARVTRLTVDTVDAEAAFLQGDIVDEALPGAAAMSSIGDVQAGLFSTPICSIIATIATVSMALCTRNRTCARTCKGCPFTQQRTCNCTIA